MTELMRKAFCLLMIVTMAATFAPASLATSFILNGKTQNQNRELTIRGSLGRTVESGGWVINSSKGKYLLLNFAQFQNQSWFRENQIVEAKGETPQDVMTIYQEGTPFQAREIIPISRTTGSTGNANAGNTGSNNGNGSNVNPGNEAVIGGNMLNQRTGGDTALINDRTLSGTTQVIVAGDATIQAEPDTAILNIAVVTQNKIAAQAQSENARRSDAVVRAVRAAAGAGAEVKTGGYSLQPQRVYKENQPPTIVGYEARNSVTVTLADLNRVGTVIDAASNAGANNVDGIAFTLRRDRDAKAQALRDATAEAMAKAGSIAQALGGRMTRIVEVREEGTFRPPIPIYKTEDYAQQRAVAANVPTPIEVGTLDITSRVQVVVEIAR